MRTTPWGTYARIAEQLRARFVHAAPGAAVPSEAVLAAEFGVARNTVRRALAELERDGVITARAGRGRVVSGADGGTAGFVRVAEGLRADIGAGVLGTGDRVPSESALTVRFGVSRATVRRGLALLEASGLVRAVPGKGRFVDVPERG